ncbi:MAG: type I secretion C-terminal target domain-containing protein, partial [Halioglobus sp.]
DGTDYSWSYELGGAETHPDIDEVEADDTLPESFAVRVTDTDDDIDNAVLQIDVRDDGPAASADTDLIAGIDMEVVGNVITGESEAGSGGTDVKGADGATVTAVASDNLSTQGTVGNSLSGQYGDLELNSDGGYTYTRTSAPDVGGDDVFDYIITDDDGDTSTTTLTITVGVNEPPVVQPPVELEDVPEFELRDDGMASRSDSLQFTAGSTDIVGFVFSSDYLNTLNGNTDGIVGDEIVWSISEDGQKITGSLGGDPAVELMLTEGANDLVTVELKLLSPLANELAGGNNVLDLGSVGVIATDEAGLTVEGTFDIGSIDDVPEAGDFVDPEPIANLIGATTGILNNAGFESGADNWEDINITGPVIEGVSYLQSTTGSGDTLETTLTAVSTLDNSVEIFEVVVNANGDYSFTLIEPKASIIQNIDLTNLTPGGPTPWVETPGGAIEIEGNGSGVNSSTPGAGVENNLLDGQVEGVDEFLYFQFFDPGTPGDDAASADNANFVDGVSFENNHPAGGSVTAFVRNSATNESTTLNITVGGNEPIVVEDVGFTFNEVTITWDAGKLRLTAADVETTILPEGQELTFQVEGTDGDGDVASDSFTVIVDPELGTESASLVDGVVEGMYFEASSGLSGYTDARGEFAFRPGDLVVFSIGNIVIGSVDADTVAEDGKVYLQEIAGVGLEDLNDEYVENMAVFLQSLDNDGDAGNGIVINEGIHAVFSNDSIDLASITEGELAAVLVENGYTPVTESDAMQHVREMLAQHAGVTEFEEHIDDGLALLASGDDDVFAFSLNEENTVVSISDFGEEGRDVLDLRDLLIGEEADDNAGLGNYLSVTSDGADTVIEVSSTGEFTNGDTSNVHVDQTITLEGLDLVGSDDLSVVIQNMLESGQLITD